MVAEKMEAEWAKLMPITHAAFEANGRLAPYTANRVLAAPGRR
jgi:hypothetical protein